MKNIFKNIKAKHIQVVCFYAMIVLLGLSLPLSIGYIVDLCTPDYYETGDDNFISDGTNAENRYDENIYNERSKFTYQDVNEAADYPVTPSTGEVNILVVPVEFYTKRNSPYADMILDFAEEDLNTINIAFNGDEEGKNPYWVSVKKFYNISSYDNLDLNFEITDPYTPNFDADMFLDVELNDKTNGSSRIIEDMCLDGMTNKGKPINFNEKILSK